MHDIIKISEYSGQGIGGDVSGGGYTILLLNFLPRLKAECIADMQYHMKTDESFILLEGSAVLFAAEGEKCPGELTAYKLERGKIFTVPRGIWHTQSMTEDAKILLVESSGTVAENSPRCPISEAQKEYIRLRSAELL